MSAVHSIPNWMWKYGSENGYIVAQPRWIMRVWRAYYRLHGVARHGRDLRMRRRKRYR